MSTVAREVKDGAGSKKKRRIKTESRSSSPDSAKKSKTGSKSGESKNARSIFFYEENQAAERDLNADVATHKAACQEVVKVMAEIKKLKDGGGENKKELEELRIQGLMQFIVLKKMNRMAHFKCKKVRDVTNEAKQKIDSHHLQLQNLLYEVMHLQKEITKCLEFKSKDEDIHLVNPDQFYSEAPPEISKPEVTQKDLHQQTLARLDWELEQRKSLSDSLKEKKKKKEDLVKETKSKKNYLESLQPKLNAILQATKPVQEYLDMPFDEIREQHKTATYLPRPLYVLYMQASAYRDACDKYLTVNIQGDIEVAKAIGDAKADIDEDSESDQEEQEKMSDSKRRRRHSTRTGKDKNAKADKVLRKHPLCVHLHVQCRDGSILYLTFDYLLVLEIVTVTVRLTTPHESTSVLSAGDLLTPESLLHCLYPDDLGTDTPNSSNKYALQKAKLAPFSQYISRLGRPYHWVQWLCGLQFLNDSEKAKKSEASFNSSHIETTIKRLRHRVKARVSLQKQLAGLEKCSVTVSPEYLSLFPVKITSRLTSWKRSTYEDYCEVCDGLTAVTHIRTWFRGLKGVKEFQSVAHTQSVLQQGLARETDIYFCGVIERGTAKLMFSVVMVPEYPEEPPLFSVCIHWGKDKEKTNITDQSVRDLEAEVNLHYPELMKDKSHDQLLTNQMQRLLMCFDVYLEAECEQSGEIPAEFPKEKIFTRLSRGPRRSRPYVYNPQLGFFMQR